MKSIIFILLVTSYCSSGQTKKKTNSKEIVQGVELKNALFLEAGGNGLIYSLNYERFVIKKRNFASSYRIGATPFISLIDLGHAHKSGQLFGLINGSIGRNKSKLEFGFGIIYHLNFAPEVTRKVYRSGYSYSKTDLFDRPPDPPYIFGITSQVSFRHEMAKKKLFYRISFTFTDLFFRTGKGEPIPWLIPWGGVSFGKMF